MTNFEKWDKEFRAQNLFAFNNNKNGILWLKIRAITRKDIIKRFIEENGIKIKSTTLSDQNVEVFEWAETNDPDMKCINNFLLDRNNEWYVSKGVDENKLKTELIKIKSISQGGGVDNSLDQTFVRLYVKQISDYQILCSHQAEIAATSWNFVQTSWYNNWTSFLIESLFKNKNYKNILPAVGETKSVDFFIDDMPFDLKVTYLPGDYLENEFLKLKKNKPFAWLKKQAKRNGISLRDGLNDDEQYDYLIEQLELDGHNDVVTELRNTHKVIIENVQKNPISLVEWFYLNQSPRLFGAENRLFVVLIDSANIAESWKMKRAFNKIEPKVDNYLKNFQKQKTQPIRFKYNKKPHQGVYQVYADVIFVVK